MDEAENPAEEEHQMSLEEKAQEEREKSSHPSVRTPEEHHLYTPNYVRHYPHDAWDELIDSDTHGGLVNLPHEIYHKKRGKTHHV